MSIQISESTNLIEIDWLYLFLFFLQDSLFHMFLPVFKASLVLFWLKSIEWKWMEFHIIRFPFSSTDNQQNEQQQQHKNKNNNRCNDSDGNSLKKVQNLPIQLRNQYIDTRVRIIDRRNYVRSIRKNMTNYYGQFSSFSTPFFFSNCRNKWWKMNGRKNTHSILIFQ